MDTFLDCETCPDLSDGALQRCLDAVEPPGNYSKPESIAKWKADNAAAIGLENWKRTALDPMCGGIIVISWAAEDCQIDSVARDPSDSHAEKIMLEEWAERLSKDLHQGGPRMPRFIGWNIARFDLRFLAIRCAIHNVKLPFRLPVNAKSGGQSVCDLMEVWAGYREYAKQSVVAKALGIKLEDETDGSQLWELVQKEGIGAAVRKCESDIRALREIYNRLKPIFGC